MTPATDRLTERAWQRLLERLGPDRESAAREYEAIRQRLTEFFDRRRVSLPEARADETLDRVARRIDEGEVVEHLRAYCYGVARRVLLEWQRERAKERAALEEAALVPLVRDALAVVEARVSCLRRCLEDLPAASRDLIVRYYEGAGQAHLEGRKLLADSLAITYATLKTRAHRIRVQLEDCLRRCLQDGNQ